VGTQYFTVVLSPNTPMEILSVLGAYLHDAAHDPPFQFVFCLSVSPGPQFCELELIADKTDKKPWKVQIPTSCVSLFGDWSNQQEPMGFSPKY